MNPTPEQVAAWAQQSGFLEGWSNLWMPNFQKLATLSCAWQAEADAKLCENVAWRLKAIAVSENSRATNTKAIQASDCADAIRANAPKVTT